MEYTRSTQRKITKDNVVLIRNEYNDIIISQDAWDMLANAYNKLAELEDKIEQGTLIELPCKVGDTVFTIEGGIIEEHEVLGVLVQFEELFFKILRKRDLVCKFWGSRSVFLSREEAEKRLKELQE